MKIALQMFSIAVFIFLSESAVGASSHYSCVNQDETLRIQSPDEGVVGSIILQYNRSGKLTTYEGEAVIPFSNPKYKSGEAPIVAMPFGPVQKVKSDCAVLHVIQADGTECFGRERWEVVTRQLHLLKGANNTSLFTDAVLGNDAEINGKTKSGYIVQDLTCTGEGITTSGGCFVEEDSRFSEWLQHDCQ